MDDLDAEIIDQLGYQALKAGAFSQAIALYTKAIEKDPSNGIYYTDRCGAYLGNGETEKAMEDAKKGVELSPNDSRCNMQLGIIYDAMKDYAKGLVYHEKALQLNPNDEMIWGLVRHDKTRLMKRGEDELTGVEFLEFLDSKGEEGKLLTRSPALYHFIDDIKENVQHAINYLGNPILDLFSEHMLGGIIPPEVGARRVPCDVARREYEKTRREHQKQEDGNN